MAAKYVTPKIPTNITVHLGAPYDTSAKNITVPFQEYIKNVASSEVYPNWPTDAIKANILAEISFALNRIYNEWYPSKGYSFDITSFQSSPVYSILNFQFGYLLCNNFILSFIPGYFESFMLFISELVLCVTA